MERFRRASKEAEKVSLEYLCSLRNISRQACYQHKYRQISKEVYENWIVKLVKQIRKRLPTCGGRNLWKTVIRYLRLFKLKAIGRDSFFKLIKRHNLSVKYPKRAKHQTTYSRHSYVVQPNLYKNIKVTKPEQVLVADITYISLESGSSYLFLITDAFSRMIVGYYLSDNLSYEGAEIALKRAMKHISNAEGVIHHSDRGVQYCCHNFLDALKEFKMLSSMTDEDHCAQNALAERVNGMLKKEHGCGLTFKSLKEARVFVEQAIDNYNYLCIHGSLNGKTPAEVHYGEDKALDNFLKSINKDMESFPYPKTKLNV